MGDSAACILIVLGLPDALSKRDADLSAILGSLSKGKPVVAPAKNLGGTPQKYKDVSFDLPKNWTTNTPKEFENKLTFLVPADANQKGIAEELYILINDPVLKSIDGEEFNSSIQKLVDQIQPGLKAQGAATKSSFGDLEGRVIRFSGQLTGKTVDLTVYSFMSGSGACALIALGYPDVLSKREPYVTSILTSMTRSGGGAVVEEPRSTIKKIPGGSAQKYKGVSFDIPNTWTAQSDQNNMVLIPAGSDPRAGKEIYLFANDPTLKALEGVDFDRVIQTAATSALPSATLQGTVKRTTFGELEGRILRYAGKGQDGKDYEIRVFAFPGSASVCALLAIGLPEVLSQRESEVAAIVGSMSKIVSKGGAIPEELAGSWAWITNFNANNGGGRTTSKILTLNANGTYEFHAETDNSGYGNDFNWGAWSSSNDAGTWTATDSSITFQSQGGKTTTYSLEKKNHPKNVRDPMIVLDGQPFVTYGPKDPW
jgi:hypothetical protein